MSRFDTLKPQTQEENMIDVYKEYESIEEVGTWDYDWTIGALLRKKDDDTLWFGVDSGCSCTSFGDGLDVEDLAPVKNWQEAVELAKAEISYGDSKMFTDEEVYEFAKRLAEANR
jgi:hypothetical protein